MFQTNAVEKIRAQILCAMTFFFRKSCRLLDNVEKYRAEQATDDYDARTLHAGCLRLQTHTHTHTHTHTGCVTLNIAFTAKIVTRNRLSDIVYSSI